MGMDINGIIQKKIDGEWKTVLLKFSWFEGQRNRELFHRLMELENPLDRKSDIIFNELYPEMAKGYEGWGYTIEEIIEKLKAGDDFICDCEHGYLTLEEMQKKKTRYHKKTLKDEYPYFVEELEELFARENPADCRIVFCFDV